MQNYKKNFVKQALAWVLAAVMVIAMVPVGVFAQDPQPADPASGDNKEIANSIDSRNIGKDAKNAVHAFVGVQVGGDGNLPLASATGEQFIPIEGIRGYFQWLEDGGYVSPVYTAVSDASGRLNIECRPYIAADGKIIKFDADPTVSGGNEKYRFWVDNTSINTYNKNHKTNYQLQYITGEQVIFPKGPTTVTQGGSGSDTPKNTHENWKILLMERPNQIGRAHV